MRRWIALSSILFAALVLAKAHVVGLYGIDVSGKPRLGAQVVFETNYSRLKALATLSLDFEIFGGNLFSRMLVLDPIRVFDVDIDEVSLSYGYIKVDEPPLLAIDPNSWVLKIGSTYVVFSKESWLWTRAGPVFVGTSFEGRWKAGLDLDFGKFEFFVYSKRSGGYFFAFRIGPVVFGNENGLFLKVIGNGLSLEFFFDRNRELHTYGLIKGENGYIMFRKDYIEIFEKVGKIYATWRLSKESKEFYVGYRVGF